MDFNDYQNQTAETAVYPEDEALSYLGLGVAGEAGEVAESIKKYKRGKSAEGALDEEQLEDLPGELGDVLWYIARLADELDVDLDDVADANLAKLNDRQQRGSLHTHD